MKAVISVIGKDRVGILAMVATECADAGMNILDVSQTIVDELFTMTMVIEFDEKQHPLADFSEHMEALGKEKDLVIRVMHQDIFHSMHRI